MVWIVSVCVFPLFLCAYTLLQLSLCSQITGLWAMASCVKPEQIVSEVFLKTLFVYTCKPAYCSVNTHHKCEDNVSKRVLHSYPQLIHDPFWATVALKGKQSLILCEYLNTGRWDVRTRCRFVYDNVSLFWKMFRFLTALVANLCSEANS